jgi:hypothetical protein
LKGSIFVTTPIANRQSPIGNFISRAKARTIFHRIHKSMSHAAVVTGGIEVRDPGEMKRIQFQNDAGARWACTLLSIADASRQY